MTNGFQKKQVKGKRGEKEPKPGNPTEKFRQLDNMGTNIQLLS